MVTQDEEYTPPLRDATRVEEATTVLQAVVKEYQKLQPVPSSLNTWLRRKLHWVRGTEFLLSKVILLKKRKVKEVT